MASVFLKVLIGVHLFLVLWGLAGLSEYLGLQLWPGSLQNIHFPPGVQLLHWLAICSGGFVFLIGYWKRWVHIPVAMGFAYTFMATLCAVETIDFLPGPYRYLAMAAEYLAYLSILFFLRQSQSVRQRLSS